MNNELKHYGVLGMKWGKRKAKIQEHMAKRKAEKQTIKNSKKTLKTQYKQYGNLEDSMIYRKNIRQKDLHKAYRNLDSMLTGSRYGNKKAEAYAHKALQAIDKELSKTGKTPKYDARKVNAHIEKAMDVIERETRKHEDIIRKKYPSW